MSSLWSQLFSCWAGAFATPEEWKTPEASENEQKQLPPPTEPVKTSTQGGKKEGKVVISQTASPVATNEPPQEYESTVEWECWDDDEVDEDQDRDIEIPTISLPSSPIKATVLSSTQTFDTIVNKKKEEEEPEEDFFSDMEPEVVPAKKVFIEEKPKTTSSRIKMSMDVDDDIVSHKRMPEIARNTNEARTKGHRRWLGR